MIGNRWQGHFFNLELGRSTLSQECWLIDRLWWEQYGFLIQCKEGLAFEDVDYQKKKKTHEWIGVGIYEVWKGGAYFDSKEIS